MSLTEVRKVKTEPQVEYKLTKKKTDAKSYVANKLNFNLRKNNSSQIKENKDNNDEESDYDETEEDDSESINKEEEQEEASSSFRSLINDAQIKSEARLELSTTKDLSSCGTYKVKIQRRRSSASISNSLSFKQKENESLINQIFNSSLNENNNGKFWLQITFFSFIVILYMSALIYKENFFLTLMPENGNQKLITQRSCFALLSISSRSIFKCQSKSSKSFTF